MSSVVTPPFKTTLRSIVTAESMQSIGKALGAVLSGGEVFALNGDVGSGKTTFTKGLAAGMGVTDVVQSPTFTIERLYAAHNAMQLAHYDFYRLSEPGIMRAELQEAVTTEGNVVVVEWNETVEDVLPAETTIHCTFSHDPSSARTIEFVVPTNFQQVIAVLKEELQ